MNRGNLKIKIFADGASLPEMLAAHQDRSVDGFTTNPTLMRKAGVTDYEKFAHELLAKVKEMPISFEVFSDDAPEMERQARKIAAWGKNVYVKIPVVNTKGISSAPLIKKLASEGVHLNVTAILTAAQVREVAGALSPKVPSVVSVFAGRIADTGVDPMPAMKECAKILKPLPACELLWASCREILNLVQAQECGCHIITVPNDVLKKMGGLGKDLTQVSLETVQTFYEDGKKAGFTL